ncbi:hypothetical protein GCM10009778_09380 [Microbacterium terricola]
MVIGLEPGHFELGTEPRSIAMALKPGRVEPSRCRSRDERQARRSVKAARDTLWPRGHRERRK